MFCVWSPFIDLLYYDVLQFDPVFLHSVSLKQQMIQMKDDTGLQESI